MYGIQHFSSNLHNLSHLAQEVERFGILSNFNVYSFETKSREIKLMVRSGNLPLRQICRRISEADFASSNELLNLEDSAEIILSGKEIKID